ncbi:MAG TPA: response regulator transcription factor, partial [Ensifer sp.]|nr:response regulator transcription factor [Ensifer sp.]
AMETSPMKTHRHVDLPAGEKIMFVAAERDLLSECLIQVLANRFPNLEIDARKADVNLPDTRLSGVSLVILYKLSLAAVVRVSSGIREADGSIRIGVVLGSEEAMDPALSLLARHQTIDGVLPADLRLDVFLATIELLLRGGEHFPAALLREVSPQAIQGNPVANASQHEGQQPGRSPDADLTTREVQILNLLCDGIQNKTIADQLNLSENTVKVHIRNLYKKMNVRNRTEAASRFFRGE